MELRPAALAAGPAAMHEIAKNVAKVSKAAKIFRAAVARAGTGTGTSTSASIGIVSIVTPLCLRRARLVDLARVEGSPLLGIAEKGVSAGNVLEPGLRVFISRVEVGMVLFRELSISLANILIRRSLRDAERLIWISHARCFVSIK